MSIKVSQLEQSIRQDPATSYWLKEQLEFTESRDICDAIRDAETLLHILKQRHSMVVRENLVNPE